MPRLSNPFEADLFAPQIHKTVPAFDSIPVTDAEAELFAGNTVFTVEPDTTGEAETRGASRRRAARGAQLAEVDAPPVMETR